VRLKGSLTYFFWQVIAVCVMRITRLSWHARIENV
jgi:hypothetical protein